MTEITKLRPITWHSMSKTDVGKVRQVNEDSVLDLSKLGLWAVCDGMGGHAAGDVASSMVVSALGGLPELPSLADMVDAIDDALIDINARILEYADIMLEQRTLGSTVVSLLIKGRVGVCLWAGDSRLYRYRNNTLSQLSQDHSQVEELMQQGFLSEDEAANHPESNVITRAVGASEELYVDINVFSVQVGDTFLLCSDGLYNAVDVPAAMGHVGVVDVDTIAEQLMQQALDSGAPDNVSLIVVKGMPVSASSETAPGSQIADSSL